MLLITNQLPAMHATFSVHNLFEITNNIPGYMHIKRYLSKTSGNKDIRCRLSCSKRALLYVSSDRIILKKKIYCFRVIGISTRNLTNCRKNAKKQLVKASGTNVCFDFFFIKKPLRRKCRLNYNKQVETLRKKTVRQPCKTHVQLKLSCCALILAKSFIPQL